MSFEIYTPGSGRGRPRSSGTVAIGKNGSLTFVKADLESIGVGDSVVLLLDRDGPRMAVRKPADGETTLRVTGKGPGGTISARGAFLAIGLDVVSLAGRRPVTVVAEQGLLLVQLDATQPASPKLAASAKGKANAEAPPREPTSAPVSAENPKPPAAPPRPPAASGDDDPHKIDWDRRLKIAVNNGVALDGLSKLLAVPYSHDIAVRRAEAAALGKLSTKQWNDVERQATAYAEDLRIARDRKVAA